MVSLINFFRSRSIESTYDKNMKMFAAFSAHNVKLLFFFFNFFITGPEKALLWSKCNQSLLLTMSLINDVSSAINPFVCITANYSSNHQPSTGYSSYVQTSSASIQPH